MKKTNIKAKKLISLMILSLIMSLFVAQSSVFAQEPPSVDNLFDPPVEDEAPPAPQRADIPVEPEPIPEPEQYHPAPPPLNLPAPPETPNSGPEAMYMLVLLAASIGGGYAYNVSKQDI